MRRTYSCNPVPALLPCPEFGFVEGVVFRADDNEVEGHCEQEMKAGLFLVVEFGYIGKQGICAAVAE